MRNLTIAAALGATLLTFVPSEPAAAAPNGSYRESCRRVRDIGNQRNPTISAQCRDERGRYRDSTLAYRRCRDDVVNDSGRLACARGGGGGGGGGGGFPGYPGGPGNGGGGGGGGGGANRPLPGGSWARSCQPSEWSRNVLTARCEDGNSRRQVSTLDLRTCPTGRAGNLYGRLVCQ